MRPTTAPRSSTLVIFEVRPDRCAFHDQFGHGHCGVAACSVAMTDLHSFADDVRGLLIVLFVQRRHVESRRWIFWQMSHQTGRGLGWPSPGGRVKIPQRDEPERPLLEPDCPVVEFCWPGA
jgi:hypothetical protein